MDIKAADVKKLRDETDAPIMECKNALVEAEGDIEKARQILREKGKAAAAKRADRNTSEGIARFVVSPDGKTAAGLVVECETDFVARNEDFKALVAKLADGMLAAGSASAETVVDGQTVAEHLTAAVTTIRENIQLKRAEFLTAGDGIIAIYNHHDGKKASAVEVKGSASNLQPVGAQVAIQTVAFQAKYLTKDDVPADIINAEIEIEKQRAMNEGKNEQMAENIAKGRVNKEFYQRDVLLEQPFYLDGKKTTTSYINEEAQGGSIEVVRYVRLVVGEASA
jgi:elongation factor Ts